MQRQKPYGLLSVFSFILAGIGYLVHQLVSTAGHLSLNAANEISNLYQFDAAQTQEVFELYQKLQTEQYKTFFDWTIGTYNNTPLMLAILFAVLGLVFAVICFLNRK